MSGSRSSTSLEIFWRKRRVAPRIYSLGCCYKTYIGHSKAVNRKERTRSLRIALLKDAIESISLRVKEIRTRQGSSLASTFHSRRILDKLPSKSEAVS